MKKIKKFIKEHKKDLALGAGLAIFGAITYKRESKKLEKEIIRERYGEIIEVEYEIIDYDK